MGFDIYGIRPDGTKPPKIQDWRDEKAVEAYFEWQDKTKGAYFRNNVWWWHPLWDFIFEVCPDIISEEVFSSGHHNSGQRIDKETATKIGARLLHLIDQGEVKKHETRYMKFLEDLPKEKCTFCKGTGMRTVNKPDRPLPQTVNELLEEFEKMMAEKKRSKSSAVAPCNACKGEGTVENFQCHYPFSEENTRDFAEFCLHSGGFEIC